MEFSNILVSTDFSEESCSAFDFASYQAKMFGSQVTLIHVYEEFQVPNDLRRIIIPPDQEKGMRQDYILAAEASLQKLADRHFHGQEVSCLAKMSKRSAATEICDWAERNQCNLIVIGSVGKGTAQALFLGSTTARLIRSAPCPVLVIPQSASKESS